MSEEAPKLGAENVGSVAARDKAAEQSEGTAQDKADRRWGVGQDKSTSRAAQRPGGVTVPSADFVSGPTTGERVKFANHIVRPAKEWVPIRGDLDTHQEGRGAEVSVKGETIEKYNTFLTTYVSTLAQSKDLETILQSDEGKADKLLMDRFSEEIRDKDGKIIAREVNKEKIEAFLKTSAGLAETTMLLEEDAVWINIGLGVNTIMKSQTSRGQQNQDESKAVLDRIFTLPGIAKTGAEHTLLAGSALVLLLTTTGKSKIEFKNDADLLNALQSIAPSKKEYLKFKTGIDLNQVDATGKYKEGYQPDVTGLKARYTNDIKLRKEFYEQLSLDKPARFGGKVPRSNRIRSLHGFIFENEGPEGLPVSHDQEIMEVYRDELGLSKEKKDQLIAMAKAIQKVRIRYGEKDIAIQQSGEAQVQDKKVIESLKEKREKMAKNPEEFRAEEREEHTKKKEEAEEAKELVEKKKAELLEGPESIGERDLIVQALEDELTSTEFGVARSDDLEGAVATRKKVLEGLVTAAKTKLTKAQGTKLKDIRDSRDKILTAFGTGMGNLAGAKTVGTVPDLGAGLTSVIGAIESSHESMIAPLQSEYEKLTAQLTGLEEKYSDYERAVSERNLAMLNLTAREPDHLQKATDAYDEFTGTSTRAIALCTPEEVRTLSVEELTKKLSGASVSGTEEEHLQIALQAKAHEEVDRTAQLLSHQKTALAVLSGLTPPITPDDVLRIRQSELFSELRLHFASATDPDAKARETLNHAYSGVSRQRITLAEAQVTQEIAHYDLVIEEAEENIKDSSDFKDKIAEVDVAIGILEKATSLGVDNQLSRVYEIADDPQALADLADKRPINAADTAFSPAEQKLKEEKWVYEWYRILKPDYATSVDRDKQFTALTRIFPPADLKAFLQIHFYGTTGPALQRTTQELINYAREHALAA